MALRLFDNEHFLKLESVNEGQLLDHVPAHVYRIAMMPEGMGQTPILVKDRKQFVVGTRRFGDFQKRFTRITEHYDPTMPALGVILLGLKGSGKSFLAEVVCNWALGRDMPVLLIDKAYPSQLIMTFVKLMGPCVVYFDEFGKIYPEQSNDSPDQRDMLSYFSDSSTQGVINIVTANDGGELLDFYFNRPQRFRFAMRYSDLSIEEVDEIAEEYHLKDWMRLQMHRMAAACGLSWDMARDISLMLRNCTSPEEARDQLQYLNVPGWVSLVAGIHGVWRHGEEVINECIRARFLDERLLQVKILHEETGEVLESFDVPFDDPAIMGESQDVNGDAEYDRVWADVASPVPNVKSKNKQRAQELAAGKVLYTFVRPAEHLRLKVQTHLICNHTQGSSVGISSISRSRRDFDRAQQELKKKAEKEKEAGGSTVTAVDPDPFGAAPNGAGDLDFSAPTETYDTGESVNDGISALFQSAGRGSLPGYLTISGAKNFEATVTDVSAQRSGQ